MGEIPSASCDRLIAPAVEAEVPLPPLADESDDDEIDGQEGVEVEPLRKAASPTMPSAADVEDHRITHVPYRSWCMECNMGRGLGEQRGSHAGRAHDIPIVGIDFLYITAGGSSVVTNLNDVTRESRLPENMARLSSV